MIPAEATAEGLVEFAQDSTAPKGLMFYHAHEGRPLATPWQVAALRAEALAKHALPEGLLLDCACGSGIQPLRTLRHCNGPFLGLSWTPSEPEQVR